MRFTLVITAFVGAVSELAIPAEFFQADFRSVVGGGDKVLQAKKMLLRGVDFVFALNPSVLACGIRPGGYEPDLIVNRELAEIFAKLLLSFTVYRGERVGELSLSVGWFD